MHFLKEKNIYSVARK